MTDPSLQSPLQGPPQPAELYSPQRRTALVLTGTGTAGAYHAGVLRALHEAGVKLDVVAGRGVGVVGALFAAVDGAQRLWDEKGFWRSPVVKSFYGWRLGPRVAMWALALAVAIVVVPILVTAAGLVVFPIDFLLRMVGVSGESALLPRYFALAGAAFAPDMLPTWLPRLALLVLAVAAVVVMVSGRRHLHRRSRGAPWWRAIASPISSTEPADHCWQVLWDLLRGATQLKRPTAVDLSRRYSELLAENIGQPGFRELLIVVHDVDAHRDLVFALVAEPRRRDLVRRPTAEGAEHRRAEVFDLAGTGRDHLADAVSAALTLPVASEAHAVTFSPDAYWRGETHRLCDRPGSIARVLDELVDLGVEQIVLVSAAPESPGPHTLAAPRLDGRARLGEYLQSAESASIRDVTIAASGPAPRVFTIRPAHNPIGPFDSDGGYDDRSDRLQPLNELINRGYEDAYHQFIEPVVGASGERVGSRT